MSLQAVTQLANDEKLINVDLLGHVFSFDVADVDLEAVARLEAYLPKVGGGFKLEMYTELEELFSALVGHENFAKAIAGKNKSIKNLAKLTLVVVEILTEVTAYYEHSASATKGA